MITKINTRVTGTEIATKIDESIFFILKRFFFTKGNAKLAFTYFDLFFRNFKVSFHLSTAGYRIKNPKRPQKRLTMLNGSFI